MGLLRALHIEGLPLTMTASKLSELMSAYGPVQYAEVRLRLRELGLGYSVTALLQGLGSSTQVNAQAPPQQQQANEDSRQRSVALITSRDQL